MIGTARAAGIGEDQDPLLVIHEGLRLGEIGRAGAGFDRETVEPTRSRFPHDAPRAAGHFRHDLRAEPLHDLVERPLHGGERRQALDHAVAPFDGLAALDRLAVAVDGPGREIAFGIGEGLVELHREGMGEIIEHVLARRDVYLDIVPFPGRDLREPALHQRFAGRDDLDDGRVARLEIAIDRSDQGRRLHAGQQMAKEALLGGFEGGPRR